MTVILRKPGKQPNEYQQAGGWRPIALLNTMGKVIESLLAQRLASFAEENGLLPDEQMGNRKGRSTETALRLLTDLVRTAWKHGGAATLLSLDILSAFSFVDYRRLLANLQALKVPI